MIIKNKIFPFPGYKAINLFGLIFTKRDLSDVDINHENIHTRQIYECLIVALIILLIICILSHISFWWLLLSIPAFYIIYGIEYIIRFFMNLKKSLNEVYHLVSFEKEAYDNENNLAYLRWRKAFAWLEYM